METLKTVLDQRLMQPVQEFILSRVPYDAPPTIFAEVPDPSPVNEVDPV